jgi:hypothetical protein
MCYIGYAPVIKSTTTLLGGLLAYSHVPKCFTSDRKTKRETQTKKNKFERERERDLNFDLVYDIFCLSK